MHTPVVTQLLAWHEAVESNDIHSAIAHHDAVARFIVEQSEAGNEVAEAVFEAAIIPAEAFIAWGEQKKVLKEQLAKSPEQLRADFDEGVEQATDLLDKLKAADNSAEVMRLSELMRDAMAAIVINATAVDHKPADTDEESGEETDDEPEKLVDSEE